MQIGIDSFVSGSLDPARQDPASQARRVSQLLEEIELADRAGLDVFGIGEHHREEFIASSPAVLLAAAAARTRHIRLASAVTVLSSDDPIRIFQQFATLDLISQGRAEIIVGRGSFIESYPLFGYDMDHYDLLFAEKLDLLLKVRGQTHVHWQGQHRAPLTGQGVYPRPLQPVLPIHLGVGGTPQSFVRAGTLGLPLMIAIIGGEPHRFRPLVDLYREAGRRAGHPPEQLSVGLHQIGLVADSEEVAADTLFPAYAGIMTKIGRERGWPPTTRAQFDAGRSAGAALLVGDADMVAQKILHQHEALGGLSRVAVKLDNAGLPHEAMMRAIELLGAKVAPKVRAAIGAKMAAVA